MNAKQTIQALTQNIEYITPTQTKATVFGMLNLVPALMLTKKTASEYGFWGSFKLSNTKQVMKDNPVLTGVYVALSAAQLYYAAKHLYEQNKEAKADEIRRVIDLLDDPDSDLIITDEDRLRFLGIEGWDKV